MASDVAQPSMSHSPAYYQNQPISSPSYEAYQPYTATAPIRPPPAVPSKAYAPSRHSPPTTAQRARKQGESRRPSRVASLDSHGIRRNSPQESYQNSISLSSQTENWFVDSLLETGEGQHTASHVQSSSQRHIPAAGGSRGHTVTYTYAAEDPAANSPEDHAIRVLVSSWPLALPSIYHR